MLKERLIENLYYKDLFKVHFLNRIWTTLNLPFPLTLLLLEKIRLLN